MTVPEVDVDELDRARAAGATLIDVRNPVEYDEVHVPGAVLIPLPEVPDRLGDLPATGGRPLYVICRTGPRSHRAAEYLIANGVDAVNVAGGTLAWVESGRPFATGRDPG